MFEVAVFALAKTGTKLDLALVINYCAVTPKVVSLSEVQQQTFLFIWNKSCVMVKEKRVEQ